MRWRSSELLELREAVVGVQLCERSEWRAREEEVQCCCRCCCRLHCFWLWGWGRGIEDGEHDDGVEFRIGIGIGTDVVLGERGKW